MFSISGDAAPAALSMAPVLLAANGLRRQASTSRHPGLASMDEPVLAASLVRPDLRARTESRTPTGLAPLDALLDGGFPRGQLAELIGPRTSGRTRVLLGTLAGATARGGWAALVDATDALDPAAAAALGIPLGRLLWIRCGGRLVTAWRAADVLVQGGGFELVVVDLGDLPPWALARTPPAIFVRLQRAVERATTGLLLVGPRRVAGSLAAIAVGLAPRAVHWGPGGPGLLAGFETEARLIRSRTRAPGAGVRLAWTVLEPRHAGARGALPRLRAAGPGAF
jgi:recombination protein RecA